MTQNKINLTIGILKLFNFDALKFQLEHTKELINKLPKNYRERVNVFISDNCSNDDTKSFLDDFSKKNSWLKYYIHPQRVLYDVNYLTPYKKSTSDYVWIIALDDFICSSNILKEIFDLLDRYRPVGVNFCTTTFDGDLPQKIKPENIKIITNSIDKLNIIPRGGKLSANIIKKIIVPQNSELRKFIGVSYMHLSLQAWLAIEFKEISFLRIEQNLVFGRQKWGDLNNYHPRYACSMLDALAFKYFVNKHPEKFKLLYYPGIREYLFIIRNIISGTTSCWHADMLHEFIHNSFFMFREKNTP